MSKSKVKDIRYSLRWRVKTLGLQCDWTSWTQEVQSITSSWTGEPPVHGQVHFQCKNPPVQFIVKMFQKKDGGFVEEPRALCTVHQFSQSVIRSSRLRIISPEDYLAMKIQNS